MFPPTIIMWASSLALASSMGASDKLDSILADHVAVEDDTYQKVLGAAFVVVDKNGPIYAGSAGRIDLDPSSMPWDLDTITSMASMTKLVTMTAVMQLVEKGQMCLEDEMTELLPELASQQILRGFTENGKPILEDNNQTITLWNLLTHTVGLAYDVADPDLSRWSAAIGRAPGCNDWDIEGITTPLKHVPGEGWTYGTATDWAGLALQRSTGIPLEEYVRENIFDKLAMSDSTYRCSAAFPPAERTAGYSVRNDQGGLDPTPNIYPNQLNGKHEIASGGAGLVTTARDFARFLTGFLDGKLLKKETMEKMLQPQLDDRQEEYLTKTRAAAPGISPEFPLELKVNHGIGGIINLEDAPGKRPKGSFAWSGVYNSRWWIDPVRQIAAVQVTNVSPFGDGVPNRLYDELERAVYADILKE